MDATIRIIIVMWVVTYPTPCAIGYDTRPRWFPGLKRMGPAGRGRWHLLKNLGDALWSLFDQQRPMSYATL